MRITNTMLNNNFSTSISQTAERLYKVETQALTEKRLNAPSDDPVDAVTALVLRSKVNDIEQYQENIAQGQTVLSTTESIVTEVVDLLEQVNTLVVQGASDTVSDSDRVSIAYEVDQILEQVYSLANNFSGSTYTFGGTNTERDPYQATRDADGAITAVTTTGTNGDIVALISDNVTVKVNTNGEDLFEGDVNIFDLLVKVRDDLTSGDTDAIQQNLVKISGASDQVINIQSIIGSRENRLDAAESRTESDLTSFSEHLSNVEDIDATEAIINYQSELLSLQISLQVGAKILQPSLADFLS